MKVLQSVTAINMCSNVSHCVKSHSLQFSFLILDSLPKTIKTAATQIVFNVQS